MRDSKLLILDEGTTHHSYTVTCTDPRLSVATSAIDFKTDTVIQSSLRNELKPDVTVITVAHRLQTILDSDKIVSRLDGASLRQLTPVHRWSWMMVVLSVSSPFCAMAFVLKSITGRVRRAQGATKKPEGQATGVGR